MQLRLHVHAGIFIPDISDGAIGCSRERVAAETDLMDVPPSDNCDSDAGSPIRVANAVLVKEILQAGSAFLNPLQSRLLGYVSLRYSASDEEREDLVADILSVFIQNLKNGLFRGDSVRSLNSYVYGIARLKILKAVERAGRRHELSQHLVSGDLPVSRFTDPEAKTARNELLDQIYSGLDERCREIVRLKFISGWTDDEIAALKKVSPITVRTTLSRCLKKARNLKVVAEIMHQNARSGD